MKSCPSPNRNRQLGSNCIFQLRLQLFCNRRRLPPNHYPIMANRFYKHVPLYPMVALSSARLGWGRDAMAKVNGAQKRGAYR